MEDMDIILIAIAIVFYIVIITFMKKRNYEDKDEVLYFHLLENGCTYCGDSFSLSTTGGDYLKLNCLSCKNAYEISPELNWARAYQDNH